jgi:hypothetical protein
VGRSLGDIGVKIGDLILCQTGNVGLVISEPYNKHDFKVRVVDVLWQGSDKPAAMDVTAFDNGWASVIK